jgi:hypothetical protein
MMSLEAHVQGTVLQKSIFAGAGRQSRAELVVLARDAQAFPLMVDMPVIVRHQDRGAPRLDHRHDQALCRRRAVI